MFQAPLGGRYAVRSELAAGGNGRIYLAEDLKLGRPVAVKVVVGSPLVPLAEGTRRLEREARVAGAINHPNVCAVSDVGRLDDGRPFLVMELLTGETLATRLGREQKLSVPHAIDLAQQMLAGLDAAHRRGIIHRDIKPENMFLTHLGPGRQLLKVLDFGTAQVPGMDSPHGEELTAAGIVIGTMQYMSPEQLKGVRDFDTRTDVYSCGVVIYEMLVGARPFADLPEERVAEAIAFTQAPSILKHLPALPRGIARAIDSALSVDRSRRHADAAAFLEALQAAPTPLTAPTGVLSNLATPSVAISLSPESALPSTKLVVDDWDLPTHQNSPGNALPVRPPSTPDWDLPTRENSPADNEWDMRTIESGRGPTLDDAGSVDVDIPIDAPTPPRPKR